MNKSRVVLALRERGQREVTRADIVKLLGASLKAADKVIGSLRRKGWLERAAWGEYLLIPPEQERLLEAEADLRARKSEAEDLKAGIYYDVRSVFLDLQATDEQLQVATRARELAAQQLGQARDRFSAGVADNIEVVQAQEAVAISGEQYIAALYGYNSAKGLIVAALGGAEEAVRQIIGGVR